MMKAREWIGVIALLALVVATIAGLVLTSNPATAPVLSRNAHNAATPAEPLVDQKPLHTARALAPLAATPEAQNYAHEALKLADYEVDLAFADALQRFVRVILCFRCRRERSQGAGGVQRLLVNQRLIRSGCVMRVSGQHRCRC